MNKKFQAHSAIFFANTIFGLGVPVTKLLLDEWVTPMGYMASRSLGACILFSPPGRSIIPVLSISRSSLRLPLWQ